MVLLKNRKYTKGFSLLELLLVLGVIAGLIVSAFIVYPKVQAAQRVEAEVKNIGAIQAGVKALYTAAPNYSGLNNTVALNANIFPDSMLSGEGNERKVVNSFKGDVDLIAPGNIFYIIYYSVPSAECVRLLYAVRNNFNAVLINGVAAQNDDYDRASKRCSSTEKNKLIFISS
ncbi:prepilin-type N-terminal cleavage/methylation domain-containing protein [Pectobacterium atrosepticum]|nr:prepilin-type N-terminal cleavage/methylation domain-containing protein [Pectobacterium atrosepticum]